MAVVVAVLAAEIVCALAWVHVAGRAANRSSNDAVQPIAIRPLAAALGERAELERLRSFTDLVRFERGQRRVLGGHGYADGFLVVGNDFNPLRWGRALPRPTVEGARPGDVTFGHTKIELRDVAPGARILLRILEPRFGLAVRTSAGAPSVEVTATGDGIVIANHGTAPIRRVDILAKLPLSVAWFALSAATVAMSGAALFMRRRRSRRRQAFA